jgi:hypothetical protein
MKIKISDARKLGYCSIGMRRFAEHHNLNWSQFLKEGIDEKILLETNDLLALNLVNNFHKNLGEENESR